jgi:Protein of unknown function (DUF1761)
MGLENVNLLGAVVGAAAAMGIGALWYSPFLFGNRWQSLIGKAPEEMGSPVVSMLVATVMFLLFGVGLSWILPDGASLGTGLMWSFLAFWAFVLPATVINGVFEGRGWRLAAIYLGYMLVATLVIGAILIFLGG